MQVLGYVRVSTAEQSQDGSGLDAQRQAIVAECDRRGWQLLEILEDAGYSAKNLRRPAIQDALARLKARKAEGLVVAKLDRLSRSMLDFTDLLDRALRQGWALVALDVNVDTSTPTGEAMANVIGTFAQFERRRIGERTREAMAARKIERGLTYGRTSNVPPAVVRRIKRARARKFTLSAIAASLNADGVPTAQGGKQWWPSTVSAVLARNGS